MSDWFHVASLFLFYLNSALLCLNPLAPAITRRTKCIAPAITRRTKCIAPAITRRIGFCTPLCFV